MCSKKNWIEEYKSFMVLKFFSLDTEAYCPLVRGSFPILGLLNFLIML